MGNPCSQLTRDSAIIPLLSPTINHIPLELLSEIFLQCTPSPLNLSTPITLSHVCRAWRAVAIKTPALWDAITLPMPRGGLETQVVQSLETFFRRSGARSLSIDCGLVSGVYSWYNPKKHVELVDEMLRTLVPYASRIRTLDNIAPQYLQLLRLHDLTHLKELLICEDRGVEQITYSPDENQFPDTLRILDLNRSSLDISSMKPLQDLSELYIREPVGRGQVSVYQCVNLISTLPRLTKCSLEITRAEVSFQGELRALPYVTLLELEELYIRWPKPVLVGPLLDSLGAPKLKTLGLHGEFCAKIPWLELQNFLKHSRAPLAILTLIGSGTIDDSFPESLKNCPSLENLTLSNFELNSVFLEALMLNPNEAGFRMLLPVLEYIDLVWCTFPDFRRLVSMLESRRGDPTRLKYFKMRTNALTPDELGQLNNCKIEYVDIQRY